MNGTTVRTDLVIQAALRFCLVLAMAAVILGTSLYAQPVRAQDNSAIVPGLALPLRWGMTKSEIMAVFDKQGINLEISEYKYLVDRNYHSGQLYFWAGTKNAHLPYRGQQRSIVLNLDENDRLVRVSMKLAAASPAAHQSAHASISGQLASEFGTPFEDDQSSESGGRIKTTVQAWKIPESTIVELELRESKIRQRVSATSVVNLYQDQQ